MIELIRNVLKQAGIADYTINESAQESVECFFIRRNLDLKRRTDLLEYTVTVFCPFEKKEASGDGKRMLGSSSVQIYPEMEEDEIAAAIRSAYHAASFVANPWYELVTGTAEAFVPSKGTLAGRSPEENMKEMVQALFASDTQENV